MTASKHSEERVYPYVLSGLLRIDSTGRVWRGRTRAENKNGKYFHVRVMRKGVRRYALAHRLVWLHFNGAIPGSLQINHKNGIGTDNRLGNLELATASENAIHAIRVLKVGRAANQFGERNHASKLTSEQVMEIRSRRMKGEGVCSIANDYPVGHQAISKIVRGQRW